ncbi:PPC domain-containing protein [Corallococcus sp. M34]|uniref:PPC domain-containing protein n=1 Tax=Citreicoccus inhibens TaxID=2849499 RepID=UPI001C23BC56|nr:PPC domain-containing protein [Citreicoccus inhibens]MBU8895352.1 PPC domain-containing protein [Citreicoccus inhibens]
MSGISGGETVFGLEVPAGQSKLTVTLANATNVDLYVKYGAQPTLTSYTCRSKTTTDTEQCVITAPTAGMWFITVRGTAAFTGVTLTAVATPAPDPSVVALTSALPVTGISIPADETRYYTLDVPAGQGRVAFELTGGTGDAVLLANFAAKPWPLSADCTGNLRSGTASCVINQPRAGTWYVAVQAKSALANYKLQGTFTPVAEAAEVVLADGQWMPFASTPTQDAMFRIDVPVDQVGLTMELSGAPDVADVYLKTKGRPTPTDARFCTGSTSSSCSYYTPEPGPWYVRVRSNATASDTRVRATLAPIAPLAPGESQTLTAVPQSRTLYYRLDVPADAKGLTVTATSGTSVGLALRPGSWSASALSTCNQNRCTVTKPQAGGWFITLNVAANTAATLLATVERSDLATMELADTAPVSVSVPINTRQYFRFEVPPNSEQVVFDLYARLPAPVGASMLVQYGREPTTFDAACARSYGSPTESRRCVFTRPAAGTWYAMVTSPVPLTATVRATTAQPYPLFSGWMEPALTGTQNSERLWTVDVPAGTSDLLVQLSEVMNGWDVWSQGDVALLVRREGIPNSADSDCKSDVPDAPLETCAIANPQPGRWYILARGKTDFSNVQLTATTSATPADEVEALENGVARVNLTGKVGAYRLWKLDIPAGQKRVEFDVSGGTGSLDLYVQSGTRPSPTNTVCHAAPASTGERCVIDQPQAGTWFALVRAASDFSGVYLTGRYSQDTDVAPLTPHIPVPNLTAEGTIPRLFAMDVPAGRTQLRVHVSGDLQNVELRAKRAAVPTLTDTRCTSGLGSQSMDCVVSAPAAGTWYVLLTGKYRGATLTGMDQLTQAVSGIEPLLNGSRIRVPAGAGSHYYVVSVPAGVSALEVSTVGVPKKTSGSTNLYVRRGDAPVSTYDCASTLSGTDDACTLTYPQAGLWYIDARGISYNDVELRVRHD